MARLTTKQICEEGRGVICERSVGRMPVESTTEHKEEAPEQERELSLLSAEKIPHKKVGWKKVAGASHKYDSQISSILKQLPH